MASSTRPCLRCLFLLCFRLVLEDVGMDIPFNEAMLDSSDTEMRPGKTTFN